MYKLLNAGFGDPLDDHHITIAELGFDGVRNGPMVPDDYEAMYCAVDEARKYDAVLMLLLNGGHMHCSPTQTIEMAKEAAKYIKMSELTRLHKVYIEIGNEPDLARDYFKKDAYNYMAMFFECYQEIKLVHSAIEVITAGVSNLNERGCDYLDRLRLYPMPEQAIMGYHRYPANTRPKTPHKPFLNREAEIEWLRRTAGIHRLFCTETGLSQGPHYVSRDAPLCFTKKKLYLHEKDQHAAWETEQHYNKLLGVEGVVWYQYNDGPNRDDFEDNFGVRNSLGVVKEPWK
jgi:hypothetical protein